MNKVIFLGGMRGVGKTSILNKLKKIKKIKFYSLISKNKSWHDNQIIIGKKIKSLAMKNKTLLIDLHYAAPHEPAKKDLENNNTRDYSLRYNPTLTNLMINNMISEDILFVLILLEAKITNIKSRIQKINKISVGYKKNLKLMKKINKDCFNRTYLLMKRKRINLKRFFINNDLILENAIREVKRIAYE